MDICRSQWNFLSLRWRGFKPLDISGGWVDKNNLSGKINTLTFKMLLSLII